jgi:hypothetical protein
LRDIDQTLSEVERLIKSGKQVDVHCISRYNVKYPKAKKCLEKDRKALQTFSRRALGAIAYIKPD